MRYGCIQSRKIIGSNIPRRILFVAIRNMLENFNRIIHNPHPVETRVLGDSLAIIRMSPLDELEKKRDHFGKRFRATGMRGSNVSLFSRTLVHFWDPVKKR